MSFAAAQRDVKLEIADNADDRARVGAVHRTASPAARIRAPHNRNWPHYEVRFDFTIRVPRDTQLMFCTINDGDVTVKGTRADFVINNINGPHRSGRHARLRAKP